MHRQSNARQLPEGRKKCRQSCCCTLIDVMQSAEDVLCYDLAANASSPDRLTRAERVAQAIDAGANT
jgi:hypothetical protein